MTDKPLGPTSRCYRCKAPTRPVVAHRNPDGTTTYEYECPQHRGCQWAVCK